MSKFPCVQYVLNLLLRPSSQQVIHVTYIYIYIKLSYKNKTFYPFGSADLYIMFPLALATTFIVALTTIDYGF